MTRPTSHGGGEAGPPIAGDPSSFPVDAELSRTLVAAAKIASLSTLTAEGYPYGSVVSYADDDAGNPVVLISEMAEHTVNARGDDRASMLIVDGAGAGDPLGKARLTLVGRLEVLDDPGELRDRYLEDAPVLGLLRGFHRFLVLASRGRAMPLCGRVRSYELGQRGCVPRRRCRPAVGGRRRDHRAHERRPRPTPT